MRAEAASRTPIHPARRAPLAPAPRRADTRAGKQSTHRASLTLEPRPVHRTIVRGFGSLHRHARTCSRHLSPPGLKDGPNKCGNDLIRKPCIRIGMSSTRRSHRLRLSSLALHRLWTVLSVACPRVCPMLEFQKIQRVPNYDLVGQLSDAS